jgi:hypothetical protein
MPVNRRGVVLNVGVDISFDEIPNCKKKMIKQKQLTVQITKLPVGFSMGVTLGNRYRNERA